MSRVPRKPGSRAGVLLFKQKPGGFGAGFGDGEGGLAEASSGAGVEEAGCPGDGGGKDAGVAGAEAE